MRLKAKKQFDWSIEYKKVDFKEGQEFEISEELGSKMIDANFAKRVEDEPRPKKETLIESNKSIDSIPENKKNGPKKDSKKSDKNDKE